MENRIRELRKIQGMKQLELAKKVGISSRHLRAIEQGQNFTMNIALKLSHTLNVSIEELILPDSINQDSITSSVQSPENSVEQAM